MGPLFRVRTMWKPLWVIMLCGVSLVCLLIWATHCLLRLLSSIVFLLCIVLEMRKRLFMVTVAGRNRQNLMLVIRVLVCYVVVRLLVAVMVGPAAHGQRYLVLLAVRTICEVVTLVSWNALLLSMSSCMLVTVLLCITKLLRNVRLTTRTSGPVCITVDMLSLIIPLAVLFLVRMIWVCERVVLRLCSTRFRVL